MAGERPGFGGRMIARPALGSVPTAIPDDEPAPVSEAPAAIPAPGPERSSGPVDVPAGRRTKRKPPVNVRLRASTAAHFQDAFLVEKALDFDLSLTEFASDLIEEALASRKRRRKA